MGQVASAMTFNKFLFTFLLGLAVAPSFAQTTTWSEHVAPILYAHCTSCHNAAGIAPFSLMSYADAYDNANDIADAVADRTMPPWPPDPTYSGFAHQRVLSQSDRDRIADWLTDGAPEGDTALAPDPPVYSGLAELQNPDLVSRMTPYTVNTSTDLYRCFVIPTGLSADQYITQIEALPGNRGIVHHVLIFEDTSGVPAQLDAADPGPGYTNFGGTGSSSSNLIGVWVPGQGMMSQPNGMGILLPANTNIILQVHYPGGTIGQTDSTEVRFRLNPGPLRRVYIASPLSHFNLDNGPLYIPADSVRTFYSHYQLPIGVSALSVGPHMHLIGRSIRSFGVTPSNDTIPFIDIPEWDFHWQGLYTFPRVLHLPAGTTLYSEAFYDNTTNNPENPNDPPAPVFLGEATTDEMMLVYFSYTYYLPGDENIIIDSNVVATGLPPLASSIAHTPQLYSPYPNPASDHLDFDYFLPNSSGAVLLLTDPIGRIVWKAQLDAGSTPGLQHATIQIEGFESGRYQLSLQADGVLRTKAVTIIRP